MRTARTLLIFSFLFMISLSGLAQDRPAREGGQRPQMPDNTCLIKGGTILTMATGEKVQGDILVRSGKIAAVGKDLPVPPVVPVIDATGKTVVPGFIDANSCCTLLRESRASARVDGSVLDLVDPFQQEEMEWALAQGVTSVALTPTAMNGITGRMAVVKLVPGGKDKERIVKQDAALKAGLGIGLFRLPLVRLKSAADLDKRFQAARDYQESWETYDEELEEYEKKIAEKKKEEPAGEKEEGKKEGGKEGKGKDAKDKEAGDKKENDQGGTPPEKVPEKKEEKKKKEDKERKKRFYVPPEIDALLPRSFAEEGKKGPEKPDAEKKDKLTKPARPGYSGEKKWLAKALEGSIAVHLEAHRASDILSALALKEKYHLDLVLVGCTEGYLVAEEIKAAGVPVILGPVVRPARKERSEFYHHKPENAALLAGHEIPLALAGSGRQSLETRFLSLNAAAAAGAGLDPWTALQGITLSAAKILEVDDRIGSIEKGKDGDLVILDGDPLSSAARVDQVLINGRSVYKREP